MSNLMKDTEEALNGATQTLNQAFEDMEGKTNTDISDERHVLAASAIVSALTAVCHEIAALRDSNYQKLADIESTLYSKG